MGNTTRLPVNVFCPFRKHLQ